MDIAKVNGVELEYETKGSGQPVLLIDPVVQDALLALTSEPALCDRYRFIRYRKRGWSGSTHTSPPVSITDHAADAAALLDYLEVRRAHVAGHSSGASIALQLAVDQPQRVHTLILLEPTFFTVPSAPALFANAGPALDAYAAGAHEEAVLGFLSVVSGLDPDTCRAVMENRIPGGLAPTVKDADTLFGAELPALSAWQFGPAQAGAIDAPVLSVIGAETGPLWVEVADLLQSWLPQLERITVMGVGHFLQIQQPEPVARGIAEFLARHPLQAGQREYAPGHAGLAVS